VRSRPGIGNAIEEGQADIDAGRASPYKKVKAESQGRGE